MSSVQRTVNGQTIKVDHMRHSMTRVALLGALGATLMGGAGCAPTNEAAQAEAADTADVARVVNVEIEPAGRSSFREYIRITGEVAALHDVVVSAEESGRIARFAVAKGAFVNEGDAIAKIDDAVLAAQVAEARAVADLAREQWERQQRLWEVEHIGTEIAYLQSKSAHEQAAARLQTLEARLERTVLRAPVAGVFDQKFVEVGEMVAPGTRVARVVGVRTLKIEAGVPERFALEVKRGDAALVTFDALPDREMVGQIGFVGASVDQQSRTVPIEILLGNRDGAVRPHMVANVRIQRDELTNVIVVPQQVVQRTEQGYQLFVATTRNGRLVAAARTVHLGPSYQNRVVVTDGLAEGDSVITVGARLVDDGTHLRVVQAKEGT